MMALLSAVCLVWDVNGPLICKAGQVTRYITVCGGVKVKQLATNTNFICSHNITRRNVFRNSVNTVIIGV